jgi:hypothetical protein
MGTIEELSAYLSEYIESQQWQFGGAVEDLTELYMIGGGTDKLCRFRLAWRNNWIRHKLRVSIVFPLVVRARYRKHTLQKRTVIGR